MSPKRTAVVIVGVGGQGSVFITRVLGQAALESDLPVVASELHGMAQRGGVVESTVIMGPAAHGPIVAPGEADLLIALEPLEALRALRLTRRGSRAVVGCSAIVPYTVSLGAPPYPDLEAILERVRAWLGPVAALDLADLAEKAGERRAIGAAALGAVAALDALPISADRLRETTLAMAPPRKREQNAAAFDAAFQAARPPQARQVASA